MKPQVVIRQIHHWGSLLVMAQLGVVIVAGLLLMLKKEWTFVQPASVEGVAPDIAPAVSFDELLAAARGEPRLSVETWRDLARVDIKPGAGAIKLVAKTNWEMQVDAATGEVLQVAYRRSDIIEALHDGSFFASWTKLYLFFPSGVVLLVLWLTGIYLFALPHVKKASNRARRARTIALRDEAPAPAADGDTNS